MPPAVVAVVATVATVAVKTYVASKLLAAILLVAISIASSSLMKKSSKALTQGQELTLKLDPTMPRQVALGRIATGGSLVWAFTYTDDNKKPNRYLVRIIQLADLPITGIVSIRNGKDVLTFAGDITTGLFACNQHRSKNGAACMWMRVYLGAESATADTNLITWSDGLWTSAHRGDDKAYVVLRMDNDPDAFPGGEPQLIFECDGSKLYDERFDSSIGGEGSQRWADKSTWAYSRNASVITSNVLRGLYSRNVLLFGAQAESRDLQADMLMASHNICDTTIVNGEGVSIPRYRAGIMTNSAESTGSILLELQSAFDGRIVDRGGSITLRPGAVRPPVMHFTDDDIVWTEQNIWNASIKSYADQRDVLENASMKSTVDSANTTQEARIAAGLAAQNECTEITGCVVGAITTWGNGNITGNSTYANNASGVPCGGISGATSNLCTITSSGAYNDAALTANDTYFFSNVSVNLGRINSLNSTVQTLPKGNETVRFNTLVGTDCDQGDFVVGVTDAGVVVCDTPTSSVFNDLKINQSLSAITVNQTDFFRNFTLNWANWTLQGTWNNNQSQVNKTLHDLITANNNSQTSYESQQNAILNNSIVSTLTNMNNSIVWTWQNIWNASVLSTINSKITTANDSMKSYNDQTNTLYNGSMAQTVITTNSSMKTYVDQVKLTTFNPFGKAASIPPSPWLMLMFSHPFTTFRPTLP